MMGNVAARILLKVPYRYKPGGTDEKPWKTSVKMVGGKVQTRMRTYVTAWTTRARLLPLESVITVK